MTGSKYLKHHNLQNYLSAKSYNIINTYATMCILTLEVDWNLLHKSGVFIKYRTSAI